MAAQRSGFRMDVNRLAGIGKDLHARLRRYFEPPLDEHATPLDINQAVLDDVERRVQAVGRGRRVFPYAQVVISVLASDEQRPGIEAAFEDVAERIHERFAELRCDPAPALDVQLACVAEPLAHWRAGQRLAIEYVKPAASTSGPPSAALVLRAVVLKGTATEESYTFGGSTISIGRSADPTDGMGRVRRNRIAFVDVVDGVNETVGRAHARLRFDAAAGDYRVYDEGSSNGTSIVRDGEVIPVHRRDPRGVRVRSGDEIQVGRAVIRVEISNAER